MKSSNIQIIGVPEEEEKKKDHEKILEEMRKIKEMKKLKSSLKWGRK